MVCPSGSLPTLASCCVCLVDSGTAGPVGAGAAPPPAQARYLVSIFHSTSWGFGGPAKSPMPSSLPDPPATPSRGTAPVLSCTLACSLIHMWSHTQHRATYLPRQPSPIQPCSPNATLTLEVTHLQNIPWEMFKASLGGLQLAWTSLPFFPDISRGHGSLITIFCYCTLPAGVSPQAPRAPTAPSISLGGGCRVVAGPIFLGAQGRGWRARRGGTQVQLQVFSSQNNQMQKGREKPPGQQVTQC